MHFRFRYLIFITIIIFLTLTFVFGKSEDIFYKIAKEHEEKFLKNPEKSYVSWNIAVDYYTKLYQVNGYNELKEKLIKLHIDGAIINSKNLNFFNFHYGYSPKYPVKISILSLKNYPKFNYYLFDKIIPLFVTIYNEGERELDLSKANFVLENISGSQEKILNNEDIYEKILGEDLISFPVNRILKLKDNFSFIILFSYNNPPKIFRLNYEDIIVNVIFFENLPLIESPTPKA